MACNDENRIFIFGKKSAENLYPPHQINATLE